MDLGGTNIAILGFCLIILWLIGWRSFTLYRNYRIAKQIGFPVLVSPVGAYEVFWLITRDVLTPVLRRLPFGLGDFTRFAVPGWNFLDGCRMHQELRSNAFTLATPLGISVVIADADLAEDVQKRWKHFGKSPNVYVVLNQFGPNVLSANGADWQRQRRITAPPFNERNSALVWQESLRQSQGMLDTWSSTDKITTTAADTMTLALHVLTAAGMGQSYSWQEGLASHVKPEAGHSMTYIDSIRLMIRNIKVVIILIVTSGWPQALKAALPRNVHELRTAMADVKLYLAEMVERERAAITADDEKGSSGERANLMSVLVRQSDQLTESEEKTSLKNGLTEEEIIGNLFIYNMAGHDTTANTLSYAIALLAIYPQWQDWIGEETDRVLEPDPSEYEYEKVFPQLQRCLALMYETLRLYGPVSGLPRSNLDSAQTITLDGKDYVIPPTTNVYINLTAIHCKPEHWGVDGETWRPDRWIVTPEQTADAQSETVVQPPTGTFVPWAAGPRICPGKKFSQVEFVAVIANLLRTHRVEVVRRGEWETMEDARRRVLETIRDSTVEFTLKMKRPDNFGLRWVAREMWQDGKAG